MTNCRATICLIPKHGGEDIAFKAIIPPVLILSRHGGLDDWRPNMRRLLYRHILMACLSLYGVTVSATPADDDLRLAAMAHKAGETQRAVAIWRSWADQGNVDAAYNLAVIHQYGDGVPLDYAKALQWYLQAA